MGKIMKKLHYRIGAAVILVVTVISVLVLMTRNTGIKVDREPPLIESDSIQEMTVDSMNDEVLEQQLSATDDKPQSNGGSSAEPTDSKVLSVTKNPLANVLKSGKPVLADFGRGTCIPCKMMQPILEKLQKEYAGKAEILILDIGENPVFSREYHLMVIPTQIFFDSSGKEVNRHLGFMPEDEIVAQLKSMGVER